MKTAPFGLTSYQGRLGQLSFILHRLTGLETPAFLITHFMLDTSTVYLFPSLHEEALNFYSDHTLSNPGPAGVRFLAFWLSLRIGRGGLATGKL